jgi:hypothetical protein
VIVPEIDLQRQQYLLAPIKAQSPLPQQKHRISQLCRLQFNRIHPAILPALKSPRKKILSNWRN